MQPERLTAEQKFLLAFKRLRDGKPERLPHGTPVTQNNVAKEAGSDPSALRKARYPALIRKIQAWIEINSEDDKLRKEKNDERLRSKKTQEERISQLVKERDDAQSKFLSAVIKIQELIGEIQNLRTQIDELLPPPTPLRK